MPKSVRRLLALVIILILSPVLMAIALVVLFVDGRPILFRQERSGIDGFPFTMYKFRTMSNERGVDGLMLSDEKRVTPLGRKLRASSLDELPELWNIVRGEMAFVGPRPLPVRYVLRYDATERKRLSVLPGLTGWSQINGRNSLNWDERLAMDAWYVQNKSLRLDFQIIFRTAGVVLRREGISAEGSVSMPEYKPDVDKHG